MVNFHERVDPNERSPMVQLLHKKVQRLRFSIAPAHEECEGSDSDRERCANHRYDQVGYECVPHGDESFRPTRFRTAVTAGGSGSARRQLGQPREMVSPLLKALSLTWMLAA